MVDELENVLTKASNQVEFVRRTPDRELDLFVPAESTQPASVVQVWDEHDQIARKLEVHQRTLVGPMLESRVFLKGNLVDAQRRLVLYFADNSGSGAAGARRMDRLAREVGGTCLRSSADKVRRYELSISVDHFPPEMVERKLLVVIHLVNQAGLRNVMVPYDHLHLLPSPLQHA